MEKIWIIIAAVVIFLIINFLYYKSMKGYVKKAFGKKWLNIWGNKVYFWQSSIFVSIAGTALAIYLLKWLNVLTF
ncbi:hypothetical protein [Spongiimicrobium sp. 3-5]|uniref:hypothetical protein n=1 Tax=Spongiimicrobium sp. 3-5 TaxID=3332596 RepID=UPI0039815CB5